MSTYNTHFNCEIRKIFEWLYPSSDALSGPLLFGLRSFYTSLLAIHDSPGQTVCLCRLSWLLAFPMNAH